VSNQLVCATGRVLHVAETLMDGVRLASVADPDGTRPAV
jgi:hypothetical protein